MPPPPPADPSPAPRTAPAGEHVPRNWLHLAGLAALTLVGLYFCYRVAEPFFPALAWAVSLAVIAHPLHRLVARLVPNRDVSAGVATTLVVAAIVVPVGLVLAQLANEARKAEGQADAMAGGKWKEVADRVPGGPAAREWVERRGIDPEAEARQRIAAAGRDLSGMLEGTVWGAVQALVMVFVLFFAFRDQERLLKGLRSLLPVNRPEADYLFTRTADAVHATVYATVVTGLLQGVTGGLLFWALGLPAPLLWGVVMTVLSILPIVGAFVVWVPAAVVLAAEGRWGAAGLLTVWGVLMAGPICNWVYAWVAGGRLRMHPVPALLAFVGGLAVFGVSGIVLGPVVLAVTLALVDMWKRRAGSDDTVIDPAPAAVPAGTGPPEGRSAVAAASASASA